MSTKIQKLVRAHDDWRLRRAINLIPSENIASPAVKSLLSSDLASRYSMPLNTEVHGVMVENAYRGTLVSEKVVDESTKLAREAFGAKHAFLDPLSGHIASILMLASCCKKGDLLLTMDSKDGGYDGYCQPYIPDILGLKAKYLPYDSRNGTVDGAKAAALVCKLKPSLVVLGASYLPFPHPVKEIAEACQSVGARLGYDAAHVLGILPSFQDPLKEGADIVVGNTHKTFWGPQGGVVLTNDSEIANAVTKNLTWRVLDNTHLNRIAATGQALLEWNKHGHRYAAQVVKNSKALGRELDALGYPLRYGHLGFTASHQLIIDQKRYSKFSGTDVNTAAKRLERCDIVTDAVGRIGVQEVTRMGLAEKEMGELAGIIADGARGRDVKKRAARLRKRMRLGYTI
ncbi:MAG: serine hydroxymethyltransferase [Methanobacteriota archaeon]